MIILYIINEILLCVIQVMFFVLLRFIFFYSSRAYCLNSLNYTLIYSNIRFRSYMVKNNTNQTKPNPSLGLYNETTNFPSSFRPYIELNSQFLSFLTSKIQKKFFWDNSGYLKGLYSLKKPIKLMFLQILRGHTTSYDQQNTRYTFL